MLNKKKISLNILFSLLQTGFIGLSYFLLYKFLLAQLGDNEMGVWAIVLSVSSVANLANLGIGASVTRLTAKFLSHDELADINKLLHTALIFLGSFFFLFSLLIYFISPIWLNAVVQEEFVQTAISLIPYSLAGLWINSISSVFVCCIDGLQKNYVRSILYIFSCLVLLLFSYRLVPQYGIVGVAYAQLAQAGFLLLSSLVSLRFLFSNLRLFPFTWDKPIFRTMFSFGVKEQVISLCQLCFDPLTKSLLGSFGSLSLVTYYEMANRLVIQMRGLLVSANQVFIPVFASMDERATWEQKHTLFQKVFSLNLLSTILWAVIMAATLIPISHIWIGNFEINFLVSGLCLIVAYSFNIMSSPAYFANMGSGKLNDNVIGNVLICLVNILLGHLLGYLFGRYGVLVAWSLALTLGSLYIIMVYNRKHNFSFNNLFGRLEIWMLALGILATLIVNFIFLRYPDLSILQMIGISGFLFGLYCILPVTRHPVLRSLVNKSKLKFSS